jgi:hypothetical protein
VCLQSNADGKQAERSVPEACAAANGDGAATRRPIVGRIAKANAEDRLPRLPHPLPVDREYHLSSLKSFQSGIEAQKRRRLQGQIRILLLRRLHCGCQCFPRFRHHRRSRYSEKRARCFLWPNLPRNHR